MKIGYDIIGNIAILKFDRGTKVNDKKKYAEKFLNYNKSVRSVLEKTDKFSGRLRTQATKWIAGEKTKEALYKENGCVFRLNVDSCYFSPRLASERLEIAKKVKRFERVLVMFGGVGVYSIVIAKNQKVAKVVSVEIGRECNRYARINVTRNKLVNVVELIQGDVRKRVPLLIEKFDRIVLARPRLKDSFLDIAFKVIKKNGVIHFYGFYEENEKGILRELIIKEAKKARKKIRILRIKKAGEIGPFKFRFRVDFKVL